MEGYRALSQINDDSDWVEQAFMPAFTLQKSRL
jgi:hypothetical protein